MRYPFITVGLVAVFIGYLVYVLAVKRDMKAFKATLLPGLFFIGTWLIIYFTLLR